MDDARPSVYYQECTILYTGRRQGNRDYCSISVDLTNLDSSCHKALFDCRTQYNPYLCMYCILALTLHELRAYHHVHTFQAKVLQGKIHDKTPGPLKRNLPNLPPQASCIKRERYTRGYDGGAHRLRIIG